MQEIIPSDYQSTNIRVVTKGGVTLRRLQGGGVDALHR